jgi:hypothetical protein
MDKNSSYDPTRAPEYPRLGLAFLAAAAALMVGPASAGSSPPRMGGAEILYSAPTQEVTVKVPLGDSPLYGSPALHASDFAVYENNRRQPHVRVDVEHVPVTLGVLFEFGGRYHAFNEVLGTHVVSATQSLLDELAPEDNVTLWHYGDSVGPVVPESATMGELRRSLTSLSTPPFSEVNFHDALIATLRKLQNSTGHPALVLLATGFDTFSKAGFADALAETRKSAIPLYIINLGPLIRMDLPPVATGQAPYARLDWDQAEAHLKALARAAGGRVYSPQSALDLAGIYDELMASLRTRYIIRYRSPASTADVRPRKVELKLLTSSSTGLHVDSRATVPRLIAEGQYSPQTR